MKVVMMGSYPVYHFAEELGINPKSLKRISSWNQALAGALAEVTNLEVHFITGTRVIKRTKTVEKNNLRVTYLANPKGANIFSGHQYTKYVVQKILRQIKPDLVHGIGTEHIWPYVAVSSKYPAVVTIHGIMSNIGRIIKTDFLFQKQLFIFLEKKVLKRCKHLISISPYVEQSLGEYTRANIYSVENPVAEDFFSLETKPSENKDILLVGDISRRKDIMTSLKALIKIKKRRVNLKIVGTVLEKKYYLQLLRFIEDSSMKERVVFKGFLLPQELREEYRTASMLVLSSIEETSPMCIAEAMAVGLPVVATDIGGVACMVRDEESGFLTAAGDAEGLARRIENLLDNPRLRDAMGKGGKEIAEKRWRPSFIANKIAEIYQKVLGK